MKGKEKQNKRSFFVALLLLLILIVLQPGLSLAQTIESATQKFNNRDYAGAEEELKIILQFDSENIEAQILLGEIERAKKRERSEILTERAIVDIKNRDFKSASKYLQEAILIDPENVRAKEMYLSLYEIAQIENQSIEEIIEREELIALKEAEIGIRAEEGVRVEEEEEAIEIGGEKSVREKEENKLVVGEKEKFQIGAPKVHDNIFIKVSTALTFANSNKLDYIDSRVSMLGGKLDGRYYFNFLQKKLGISFDYSGALIKVSGNEDINFMIHRMNASVRFRTYFFEDDGCKLTAGGRINYHLFLMQNREDQGAYNFTRLYGPSFGIFLSDPVIYRFMKKDFFKNVGFEGELNYLFIFAQENAPFSPEFFLGIYYDFQRYRFNLGYRRYTIQNSDVRESYNDIELGIGYRF